jgi:predicted nucleic acid-binding protein
LSSFGSGNERFFLDTNIAIYCFDDTAPLKQSRAKDLLAHGASSGMGVVSYQVLQEFCNVASASRRLALSAEQTMAFASLLLAPMNQVEPSLALLTSALKIKADAGYSFYDSLIVAAAAQTGCNILYTEDMQHGQLVAGLRIVNPFLNTANDKANEPIS